MLEKNFETKLQISGFERASYDSKARGSKSGPRISEIGMVGTVESLEPKLERHSFMQPEIPQKTYIQVEHTWGLDDATSCVTVRERRRGSKGRSVEPTLTSSL